MEKVTVDYITLRMHEVVHALNRVLTRAKNQRRSIRTYSFGEKAIFFRRSFYGLQEK